MRASLLLPWENASRPRSIAAVADLFASTFEAAAFVAVLWLRGAADLKQVKSLLCLYEIDRTGRSCRTLQEAVARCDALLMADMKCFIADRGGSDHQA